MRARASACGSCPARIPTACVAQLRAHVERHVPWGLELRFRALEGAPAWQTDPTGPAFDAARRALRAGFGVDAVLMGVGGSIPFVGPFADAFGGIPALLLGPSDPHSRIHGENESLHLADWRSVDAQRGAPARRARRVGLGRANDLINGPISPGISQPPAARNAPFVNPGAGGNSEMTRRH